MLRRIRLMAILLGLGVTSASSGAVLHDEAVQGDLSGDRLSPTVRALAPGTNSLLAAMGPGDLEYLTLDLPAGLKLDQIILAAFAGDSFVSFIAVQRGATMPVTPSTPTADGLLGWAHLSTLAGDVLAVMGASGSGAEGFVPPLAAGTYAFWLQEIDAPVTYRLDFNVTAVPEPSAYALMLGGLGLVAFAARRTRKPRASGS